MDIVLKNRISQLLIALFAIVQFVQIALQIELMYYSLCISTIIIGLSLYDEQKSKGNNSIGKHTFFNITFGMYDKINLRRVDLIIIIVMIGSMPALLNHFGSQNVLFSIAIISSIILLINKIYQKFNTKEKSTEEIPQRITFNKNYFQNILSALVYICWLLYLIPLIALFDKELELKSNLIVTSIQGCVFLALLITLQFFFQSEKEELVSNTI